MKNHGDKKKEGNNMMSIESKWHTAVHRRLTQGSWKDWNIHVESKPLHDDPKEPDGHEKLNAVKSAQETPN